ncbi:MAG TPA: hypothetical protein PLC89_21870 [Haliscomenobacter sp.]|uniref:hypothetical protein n=1 Tax=Haliscomenobacter sp. TaxID=2717303 RepID=UPI002C5F0436|nr:hypothetical protein [Haliscomenobacter sp.]HOY19977.1 hypothetical protein [Haliscomenobacter sp.]
MEKMEPFWEEITQLLYTETGLIIPDQWSKKEIDPFLRGFAGRLKEICQQDEKKAALCGIVPLKGGQLPEPSLSYHSFRRIFITKESKGNRTTREMFAIYFGYDSAHDFMTKRGVIEEPRPQTIETPPPNKPGRGLWLAILTTSIIIILLLLIKCAFSNSGNRQMIVRNERGIAWINLKNRHLNQIIDHSPFVIGIDFDPNTNTLFWANAHENYQCLSSARINSSFTGIEEITLNNRLTQRMKYPAGIALDTENKFIYCADYMDSIIIKYDYQGKLLDSSLVGKLSGRPSSVELDTKRQILYWTDVVSHKIGRIFLESGRIEPDFIRSPGKYPDGLSLDTIHNKIYWAVNGGKEIGWAHLSSPTPHWIRLSQRPSAVEVDAANGILYYTLWDNNLIGQIRLPAKQTIYNISKKNTFSAGAFSPGVVKVIDLKRK